MKNPQDTLRRFRPWKIMGLGALLLILAFSGISALSGGSDQHYGINSQQGFIASQQEPPRTKEISVNGGLVFTKRMTLTFDTAGEIGEVLVREGDRVVKGQVLARLDALTLTTLEKDLAQARLDLDNSRKSLETAKKEFPTAVLEQAEFEEQVAKAMKELEDAEEKLADFQRDSQKALATAMESKADAEALVDDANEKLEDFLLDYDNTLAAAATSKVDAEVARDEAVDRLHYYGRDQVRDLSEARKAERR